jgi:hypothetical protein
MNAKLAATADATSAANATERRKKRSADPLVALHYQLAHAKSVASLEAIVLADTSGIVVAGAGSWVVCEELAAYAPILASAQTGMALPSRMESLKGDLHVQPMEAAGQPMLLCALSPKGKTRPIRGEATSHCALGVARILETSL